MSNPPELRHIRSGSLTIPGRNGVANGMMAPVPGAQRFDGPRSPPNTSHVPCKFFRQGACQAGNACPFSHDLGAAAENVCKYFAKGNCKFGPKCANIHVLPDGRRINYGKNGVTIGAPAINLGARVNPTTYHHSSNSALTNSFMRADNIPAYTATSPYGSEDRYHQLGRQPSLEAGLPTIDTTYSSNPTSVYGSPRDDDAGRFGLGLSPVNTKGLSVLDAPLPASFDSNGISHAARYGPWPSSVPSKFGLDSPSPSLNPIKDLRNTGTLKMLHQTAFGSDDRLPQTSMSGADSGGFGSSPPMGSTPQGTSLLGGDEYFGKRTMHSSSLRFPKPRILSSSVPKVDRDWEAEFLFEEDYVPGALANEVLTPAEKARRGSTTNTLRGLDTEPPSEPLVVGSASASKFGSPGTVGSPSRWGSLFQRQREEEAILDAGSGSYGASNRSMKHVTSPFGHVGSPLRNSSLATGIGAELSSSVPSNGHTVNRSGSGESLSVLTQQLQRTRIGDEASTGSSPHLHPNAARVPSGTGLSSLAAGIIGRDRERERGLERHVSSGSIGSSVTGRFTTPIDEEDTSFVFSMEEEDDAQTRARKRISGGHLGAASPLGTGWTYANAVAGKGSGTSSTNGSGASEAATVETVGGR